MKKLFFLALATFAFVACNNQPGNEIDDPTTNPNDSTIVNDSVSEIGHDIAMLHKAGGMVFRLLGSEQTTAEEVILSLGFVKISNETTSDISHALYVYNALDDNWKGVMVLDSDEELQMFFDFIKTGKLYIEVAATYWYNTLTDLSALSYSSVENPEALYLEFSHPLWESVPSMREGNAKYWFASVTTNDYLTSDDYEGIFYDYGVSSEEFEGKGYDYDEKASRNTFESHFLNAEVFYSYEKGVEMAENTTTQYDLSFFAGDETEGAFGEFENKLIQVSFEGHYDSK